MNPEFQRHQQFPIPAALRLDHDELRAVLVCATAEPGPIGKAAMRLAQLCLPHFEQEENIVFPVFGLLNELASGDVSPEMADLLPLIYAFHAGQLGKEHQSIDAAIKALLQAARAEDCAQIVEFANKLQVHEQVEDAVIYPAVVLIGKYLRQRLWRRSGLRRSEPVGTWRSSYAAGGAGRAYRRTGGNV